MIIRQRTHWFRMLFIWHGSVPAQDTSATADTYRFFSDRAVCAWRNIYHYKVNLNPTIFTLIGIALAIFVGFCNTASYDRYWEGRKLWGTAVVETRSLIRQVFTLVDDNNNDDLAIGKKRFARITVAFCWALNEQLRGKGRQRHLERLLDKEDFERIQTKEFPPVVLLLCLGEYINGWLKAKRIDTIEAMALNQQLNNLSSVVGGCERILNTPLPFTYHVLLHRTVYVYCFLLPFGLVDVVGWMMPVLVLFISYTFVSLDAIVNEIGEPFGEEANDLALNSICQTIEYSIFEQAGIEQPPLVPNTSHFLD